MELRRARTPYIVDIDTDVLRFLRDAASFKGSDRVSQMASAQVVSLPASPSALASSPQVDPFVDAAIAAQAGAKFVAAPYFQFRSRQDAWYGLDLRLLEATKRKAPGERIAAFLQAPVETLLDGELGSAGKDLRRRGAELVLLRVSGFYPEQASVEACEAYLDAVSRLSREVMVVADAVGRFGIVCVAHGALAFSGGTRFYNAVPRDPTYDGPYTSEPVPYEVPWEWRDVAPRAIRAHLGRFSWPCPVPGCVALSPAANAPEFKEHRLHLLDHMARWAGTAGAIQVETSLESSPAPYAWVWAKALRRATALRAAA